MSTSYPPHYAFPSAPPLQRATPPPPRLHWGWVLALTILTLGVFASIWLLVQAIWARRMRGGKSTGFPLAIANVAWLPIVFLLAMAVGVAAVISHSPAVAAVGASMGDIARIVSFALYVATVFTMRTELEAEPIGIALGGGLTFLFGVFYFQYHLRDYQKPFVAGDGLGLHPGGPAGTNFNTYPAQTVEYPSRQAVEGSLGPPAPPTA